MFPPKLDCWKLTPLKVISSEEFLVVPPGPTNQQFTKLNVAIPPLLLQTMLMRTHCPQTHMGRLLCSHNSMFVLKILSPAALWLAIFLGSGRGGQSAVLFHWEAENHLSPILVRDREVWHVAVCGATRTGHNRATEQHQPILGVNPAPHRVWKFSKEMFSGIPWWSRG